MMNLDQVDELLMAINSLVDNAPYWEKSDISSHAGAIQRMAANLPALLDERERLAKELRRIRTEARATLRVDADSHQHMINFIHSLT